MNDAYAGPVIDPHHHLWDLSLGRHPWLEKPKVGNNDKGINGIEPIRRDYGVEEYLQDSTGQNIVATVHVEAGWADDSPDRESEWLDRLDKRHGVAMHYVARVPLAGEAAPLLLEREAANPRVVGIRDILSWHPEPARSFAPRDGMMSDCRWREGLKRASGLGLSFDLMLFPWQMPEALQLVHDFPDTRFVLNHCGSPIDRSAEGLALWRRGVSALADAPNVTVKISNPVAYDIAWTLDSLRMVIDHCISCFDPDRSMFASDFPVAGLHAGFGQLYSAFRTITAEYAHDEQEALFFSTANRVYGLGLTHSTQYRDHCHG